MIGSRIAAAALIVVSLMPMPAAAQRSEAPRFYRVFLTDGTALASFGEWARVDDRLIFSMPLSPGSQVTDLHLVSIPVERVDMARTERYADAVRAAQYAATRGEADFAELTDRVARTLNQVALLVDPRERLETAERARRALAEWPGSHHGYRAEEVREIVGVLDELISGLRVSTGQEPFELALSAHTVAPPPEPLLPAPDHLEVVRGLEAASQVVDSPVERVSLLRSIVALIDRAAGYLPAAIASAIRSTALGAIAEHEEVERLYADLRARVLQDASRHAARADVRALEGLRAHVRDEDARLGHKRPGHVAGLLAALGDRLEEARRLRLAQDQWLLGRDAMRSYRRAALPHIQALVDRIRPLEDIKLQAGPAPRLLRPLARVLERHARELALIEPPQHLAAIHDVFRSAFALARNAVQLRRDAVEAADLDLSRQAAAAAAGALMLLERARADLRAASEPPIPLEASRRP